MNVDADIPLLGEQRLACVQTHTHTEPAGAESLLRVPRSRKRVVRPPERDEKRITLCVHLSPTVPLERVSQHAPMVPERIRMRIVQLVQQLCRPLLVVEEEGDSPRGKIAAHMRHDARHCGLRHEGRAGCAPPPTDRHTQCDTEGEVFLVLERFWNAALATKGN